MLYAIAGKVLRWMRTPPEWKNGEAAEAHAAQQRFLARIEAQLEDDSPLRGIPCLGCEWSGACALREIACAAFRAYVHGDTPQKIARMPREPSRNTMRLVMGEKL